MEEAILKFIEDTRTAKEASGKFPTHSTRLEVLAEVTRSLNALYKAGKIDVGTTGNDKWIKAKQ